uniref:BHLH domain-containing protein n=1 Tax=Auxenochlorella protothecoides TaxID=3075 RepID=A0A1D1ZNT4_AUXPR
MEFNWGAEKQGNEASTSLGDNGRENLMLELDDKTLQCLVGSGAAGLLGSHDGPAFPSTSAGPSGSGREKRKHDDSAAYNWMAMGGFGEEEEEEADDSDDSQRRIGRKGRPMSTAAVAKATREKARRERLNEWCACGARLRAVDRGRGNGRCWLPVRGAVHGRCAGAPAREPRCRPAQTPPACHRPPPPPQL